MLKKLLLSFLLGLIISIITGYLLIPLLRRFKAGQPILKYVKNHNKKSGTPTMGGLFIVFSIVSSFFILGGWRGKISTVIVCFGVSYMAVGFLDDYLKIKQKDNMGLKPRQKIVFQIAIAVVAGIFAYKNGLTAMYLPFIQKVLDFGVFIIPITAFIFIAITNSVNLTDGIDGLAGSVSVVYLFFLAVLIYLQMIVNPSYYSLPEEYVYIIILCAITIGSLVGFLLFNVNPAKIFMGDTGSLALGALVGGVSVFSMNGAYILFIGFAFVFSSISVIVQVLYFKKTKKRVFKMAPFHHHLQLSGCSETRIDFIYCLISGIMGVLCVISYL